MTVTKPFLPLASSAALVLALTQTLSAPSATAAEPQPAPTKAAEPAAPAPYPASAKPADATPTPAETARAEAKERRAAMLAERKKRYDELRASAAEMGVEMPESPPWETLPEMAVPHDMRNEDNAAMNQWREDMRARMQERMRAITPEERQAMREERWKRMRADAAERGIEMPETPPWEEAEKRRQEMEKRFEEYRKTVEQMTDEQREAAQALFGRTPERMSRPMPYPDAGPAQESWGYPGDGAYRNAPRGMMHPHMMPYPEAPGYDQGPPPWSTGN
ncbi:hypothetical protein [Thiocystis violascens]|uniref:Uncharacterized protein n=1 Tax=Thiocystis violascens (strain ATCC 17096 / DSM 198 / 6111) TaxID=765911 RepID=I3YE28_THIV6|nr:hypothetical protein [Thiocystis violascens]AFL75246.1 hypothetical protein Thivi_3376 [Thiocystis violascens DSM 198]